MRPLTAGRLPLAADRLEGDFSSEEREKSGELIVGEGLVRFVVKEIRGGVREGEPLVLRTSRGR